MGLFGKSKSSQSDSSSIRKHTLHASTASSTVKHNPDASDIVGDSPTFKPSPPSRNAPQRQDSIASETASLRYRNSSSMLKLFGGSTSKRRSSKGPAEAPSPKITQPTEYFGGKNSTSQNRSSAANTPAVESSYDKSTSPAVETPGFGSLPTIGTPTGDGSLVSAVNKDVPGAGLNANAGPRPSDLFAGKGVQWNQIDLTVRDSTASAQPAKAEDLQSFLKARRQWIPTFKTEDAVEEEESLSTDRLANLSFNTTAVEKTGGLMSLKDLEESHKRKAALSSQLPIVTGSNGAVFDEAGTDGRRVSTSADLPPRPTAPLRNQSFRMSHFAGPSGSNGGSSGGAMTNGSGPAKSGVGSLSRKPVPRAVEGGEDVRERETASQQRGIPQRRSSMQRSRPTSGVNGSEGAATNGVSATGVSAAAADGVSGAGHTVGRPSIDTTAGFATLEMGDVVDNAGTGAMAVPHALFSSTAAGAPPRPPKADRTPSASRKSSQDPLHVNLAPVEHVGATNGATEIGAALQRVDEKVVTAPRAAPTLQTRIPGTGVAAGPY